MHNLKVNIFQYHEHFHSSFFFFSPSVGRWMSGYALMTAICRGRAIKMLCHMLTHWHTFYGYTFNIVHYCKHKWFQFNSELFSVGSQMLSMKHFWTWNFLLPFGRINQINLSQKITSRAQRRSFSVFSGLGVGKEARKRTFTETGLSPPQRSTCEA